MEEDIKKIEYFLNQADEYYDGNIDIKDCVITKEVAEAIENLIKGYKELEEENEELHKEINQRVKLKLENERIVDEDYIPKSKIREKIEEYNKMINATYGDITHQGDIRRDNCIEIRNVLQELLEERN